MGDGWMPNYRSPQDVLDPLQKLDRYLEEAGRARSDIGLEARLYYGNGEPSEWDSTISGWQRAGATHLTLNTMGSGFTTPSDHLRAIEIFAKERGLV
jgi:hypothetical protein